MDEHITFGKALFPSLSWICDLPPHNDHIAYPIVMAQTIHQVRAGIFVFKMYSFQDGSCAEILEGIFQDLADSNLSARIENWCTNTDGYAKSSYSPSLVRQYREQIGNIALEVFFDAFERDKASLWSHASHSPNAFDVYLRYLATANEATKEQCRGKIRKFLKCVLDEPLTPIVMGKKVNIGISQWTQEARENLALALVANGMYEECLDYNIKRIRPYTWCPHPHGPKEWLC